MPHSNLNPSSPDLSHITPALHPLAVAIDSLTLDPRNARTHDGRNLDSIRFSLSKFGQQQAILVDADGVVLAGNGRVEAAKSLGWTHLAVVRTELTGEKKKAYAIADNRTAELASWNAEELTAQLREINDAGLDFDSSNLAFSAKEMDAMLDDIAGALEKSDAIGRPSQLKAKTAKEDDGDRWSKIMITCDSEAHQRELLERLSVEALQVRAL